MKIYQTLSVVGFIVTAVARSTLANTTAASEGNGDTDGCPEGWAPNKQSCYLFIEEIANFTQANGGCRGHGAQLVSIGSEEENMFIRDFVGTMNLPVWIGLFRTTNDICAANACGGWEWPDGSKPGYSQWAADIVDNSVKCVFMDARGEWDHGRRCPAQRGYVCERKRILPITSADGCPVGSTWTPNNQICYIYKEENANATQANGGCRGLGAQLVSIGSKEENAFIRDFVGTMNLPVWIGLFRTTNDICAANACGNWKWPDGSKVDFTQWTADIVDNSLKCAFMDSQGEWDHGRRCSAQRGYVCERKRILPITSADGCPERCNWTLSKQSCYLYLEKSANATQANGICKGLGAQLVSIGTKEENQFIKDFVGANNLPVWIGLFRTTTDMCAANACRGWEWPDGSKPRYSQWAAAIVDNSVKCVFMDTGGEWDHGRRCSAQRGYVCEQKRLLLVTTAESTMQRSISNFPDSSSDQSSIHTIVGVIVGIVVVAIVLGAAAYLIISRRRNKREMQESRAMSHTQGLSTGSGAYENDGFEAFRRPTEGHDLECDNSVHLNTLTSEDADTIRYNNATQDHSAYEDNQAYERVNNYYSEIDPEYTHLKSIHSGETSETPQEHIIVVYANVGQK